MKSEFVAVEKGILHHCNNHLIDLKLGEHGVRGHHAVRVVTPESEHVPGLAETEMLGRQVVRREGIREKRLVMCLLFTHFSLLV